MTVRPDSKRNLRFIRLHRRRVGTLRRRFLVWQRHPHIRETQSQLRFYRTAGWHQLLLRSDIYEVEVVGGKPVLKFKDKGNPDLTWERSNMLQISRTRFRKKPGTRTSSFTTNVPRPHLRNVCNSPTDTPSITPMTVCLNCYGADIDLDLESNPRTRLLFTIRANAGFLGNNRRHCLLTSTGEPKFIDESITPYGRMEGRSLYEYYIRNFEGVNPDNGLSEWDALLHRQRRKEGFNPAAVSKEEMSPLPALSSFRRRQSRQSRSDRKRQTTEYSKATRYHIGKSALPTVREASRFQEDIRDRSQRTIHLRHRRIRIRLRLSAADEQCTTGQPELEYGYAQPLDETG